MKGKHVSILRRPGFWGVCPGARHPLGRAKGATVFLTHAHVEAELRTLTCAFKAVASEGTR